MIDADPEPMSAAEESVEEQPILPQAGPAQKSHRGHRPDKAKPAKTDDLTMVNSEPARDQEEEATAEATRAEAVAQVFSADKFTDLPINDKLKDTLSSNNYEQLTEIQKKAIPTILANRNVIMKSETGSGKTLAYLVPLIEKLYVHSIEVEKIKREYGTYCIIFSPTRELCAQIDIELQRMTLKRFSFMVGSTIMGGENPKKEKARLRKGITVLVCTPGRFLYHLQNTENIALTRLQHIIIDEADRMLDMGFEREMNECLSLIKRRCKAKFTNEAGLYHSEQISINFISATLSSKV